MARRGSRARGAGGVLLAGAVSSGGSRWKRVLGRRHSVGRFGFLRGRRWHYAILRRYFRDHGFGYMCFHLILDGRASRPMLSSLFATQLVTTPSRIISFASFCPSAARAYLSMYEQRTSPSISVTPFRSSASTLLGTVLRVEKSLCRSQHLLSTFTIPQYFFSHKTVAAHSRRPSTSEHE
jgi:hypothetical protein